MFPVSAVEKIIRSDLDEASDVRLSRPTIQAAAVMAKKDSGALLEITFDDATLLKELFAKSYCVAVVGRAFPILDGKQTLRKERTVFQGVGTPQTRRLGRPTG